jgi:hypothetical protein
MSKSKQVPASFRYVALLDLLADAAYQHRLAKSAPDSFLMSRHARSSVLASALAIECFANCLLESVEVPSSLREDLDKLSPIAKIDASLRLRQSDKFSRAQSEVQKAKELIQARNDFAHPKSVSWKATLQEPKDAGSEWMLPFTMHGQNWGSLGIPKQSPFWTHDASLAVLKVVRNLLKYVLVDVLDADEDALHMMLWPRLEFGSTLMPAVFEEIKMEIESLSQHGVDFSFLHLRPASNAA